MYSHIFCVVCLSTSDFAPDTAKELTLQYRKVGCHIPFLVPSLVFLLFFLFFCCCAHEAMDSVVYTSTPIECNSSAIPNYYINKVQLLLLLTQWPRLTSPLRLPLPRPPRSRLLTRSTQLEELFPGQWVARNFS